MRRRKRDRISDCRVYQLDNGNRALELWEGYIPVGLEHERFSNGRWYYILDPDVAAELMEAVLRGQIQDERIVEMLERMVTQEEWAVLAETLHRIAPSA